MKAAPLPLALLLCCAIALSACGGGDSEGDATANPGSEGTTTKQQGQVPQEIKAAVSTSVAEGRYSAEGAKVLSVEEDGREAVAVVELTGRTLGGQSVEVLLSRDGKGWTAYELARFVDLDKPLLVKSYETETKELPEGFGPKIVRCLVRNFGNSSQAEIEAMYLDREQALFRELGGLCLGN